MDGRHQVKEREKKMLEQLVQGHGDIGKQDVFREQRSSFWLELGPHREELARELGPAGK